MLVQEVQERKSLTRRSLAACTGEGALAEVVGACTGSNVMAAWALYLGAGPALLGAMWGLPQLAHALQFPSAWITSRFGRRRVCIVAVAAARQTTLALLVAPLFAPSPSSARALVLAVFAVSAMLGVLGYNAWVSWVGDLVPSAVRGRYFGRRTAICTLVGTLAAFAAGRFLDRASARGMTGQALTTLTVTGAIAAIATTVLMRRQHDPPGGAPVRVRFRDAIAPFRDPVARRLLHYKVVWNASVGLTASLYALTMVESMRTGFAGVACYTGAIAAMRLLFAPSWGRLVDRLGARPVLVVTSFGAAASSSLWLLAGPGRVWPVAIDAIVSGVLVGGHALALFTLPLAIAPRASRPVYMAAFVMTAGLSFGLASAAGGALAASIGHLGAGAWPLFAAAAIGRALAGVFALRLVHPSQRTIASAR